MPRRPSPRLVLIDIDGTIVDHRRAADAAVEQWLTARGWAPPADVSTLAVRWHETAERHFPDYRAGRTTFQGQRRARLRDFLPGIGVPVDGWADARLDAVFDGYLAAYEAAWRPFPDAEPCLRTLSAVVQVAALSNGDQDQQDAKVDRTGLRPRLATVLTSGSLGVAKPDPEVFRLACARLGASPAQTVYVGDRLDVDARAASAAGLRGIWLNRDGAAGPDDVEVIAGLDQLPALIFGATGELRTLS